MDRMELAIWIVSRNIKKGELAKTLGVSRQSVSAWLNGKTQLPRDIMARLESISAQRPSASSTRPAADPNATLTYALAPQCWMVDPSNKNHTLRTLAHPRWYVQAGGYGAPNDNATMGDLATHIVPTFDQAHAVLERLGVNSYNIGRFFHDRGYKIDEKLHEFSDKLIFEAHQK